MEGSGRGGDPKPWQAALCSQKTTMSGTERERERERRREGGRDFYERGVVCVREKERERRVCESEGTSCICHIILPCCSDEHEVPLHWPS